MTLYCIYMLYCMVGIYIYLEPQYLLWCLVCSVLPLGGCQKKFQRNFPIKWKIKHFYILPLVHSNQKAGKIHIFGLKGSLTIMCYCLQASISLHVLKAEKEQKLAVKETTNSKSRDGLSQVVFLVLLSTHLSALTKENKTLWRKYRTKKLISVTEEN